MRKIITALLLFIAISLPVAASSANSYSFTVADDDVTFIFRLTYGGDIVKVTLDMLSSPGNPQVVCESKVAKVGLDSNGDIAFCDPRSRTVAAVGINPDATGAHIIYLDKKGRYAKINESTRHPGFLTEFNRLKTAASSHSDNVAKPNSGAVATSGELDPAVFVAHPFGFMPSDCKTQAEVDRELTKAGWDFRSLYQFTCANSTDKFKIPYTFLGREISSMAFSWKDNRVFYYNFCITDPSWTKAQAKEFAWKVVEQFKKAGFITCAAAVKIDTNIFEQGMTNGNGIVDITVYDSSLEPNTCLYNVAAVVYPKR